jgi:GABA permease
MRNPVRSENDAFRVLLTIIGGLVLIALGAWIDTWVGVAVALAEVLLAGWWLFFRPTPQTEPPVAQAPAPSPANEFRVLVVANEAVGAPELLRELRERAGGRRTRVLVVAPVPAAPAAEWTGDAGDAPDVARQRLETSLQSMRSAGLEAEGQVGEIDPVQAVEDAVRTFAPDELVVATHPDGRGNPYEAGLVERLRGEFAMPLTHVVVDLDADRHAS